MATDSWVKHDWGSVGCVMAALEHLRVCGFKSIRTLKEFELCRMNVLIGANGAGKSNLLDVFRLVSRLC